MNVRDLRELLEDMEDDAEVRLVLDQFMPMAYDVGRVEELDVLVEVEDDETGRIRIERDDNELPICFITTGTQLGYLEHAYNAPLDVGSGR